MVEPDPPNPYLDVPVSRVADAAHNRAGDLLAGRIVGRRDTAYLLIVAGNHLRPQAGSPSAPTTRVRIGESTPEEAFGELMNAELRSLRWRIAHQAMEAANWPTLYARSVLCYQALESDEAFRKVLRDIGAGAVAARQAVICAAPASSSGPAVPPATEARLTR